MRVANPFTTIPSPLDIFTADGQRVRLRFDATHDLSFLITTVRPATGGTSALAGIGAGALSAGAYSYRVTFVTATGETEPSPASNVTTVVDPAVNGQITLSAIPTSINPNTTSRRIYRTLAGGSVYRLQSTIADNTTVSLTDNVADGALGAVAPTSNTTLDQFFSMEEDGAFTFGAGEDLRIYRGAADLMALRRAANAQELNIYETYTSASINRRGRLSTAINANFFDIKAEGAGSSMTLRLGSDSVLDLRLEGATTRGRMGRDTSYDGYLNSVYLKGVGGGGVGLTGDDEAGASGTRTGAGVYRLYNPVATSTLTGVGLNVVPEYNYTGVPVGAGRAIGVRVAPIVTALPTGELAGLLLTKTGAVDLKGAVLYNTTDETTNYERVSLRFTSNRAELISERGGTGTLRDIVCNAGTGTERPRIGGTISAQAADVGNVGAGEQDLKSYTIPANSFTGSLKAVRVTAWGSAANNANAKKLRVYFGATVIASLDLTASVALSWRADAIIVDKGGSAQAAHCTIFTSDVKTDDRNTAPAAAETGTIVVKCTAEATANNDIVQTGLVVTFLN